MNDASMRVTALETAARLGLPHELTLRAARSYLAFLKGTENAGGEWSVASAWTPLSPEILKKAKESLKGRSGTRAAAKKAQPKKQPVVMRHTKS